MQLSTIVLLIITLIILGEVSYLLARLPRNTLKTRGRALLVDTSVLMDGRITAVAKTGFIGDTLVIPRSVVGELQFLADHADSDKRARARYGLDVVTELQAMDEVEVELLQDGSKAREGVDERLLSLAKQHGAWLLTIDYNLNKVAAVEGIGVLNINELAQSIRMAHLPGEHLTLALLQKGQDAHQAVGHLPDGTMVVVEQASSQLGRTCEVEIIRNLQTAAGKMIFAKLVKKSVVQPAKARSAEASSGKAVAQEESATQLKPAKTSRSRQPARTRTTTTPAEKTDKKNDQPASSQPQRTARVAHEKTKPAEQPQPKQLAKRTSRARAATAPKSPQAASSPQSRHTKQSTTSRTSQATTQATSKKRTTRSSSRRRVDHEAALLDLVKKQTD